jgi:hypothetical protein
MLKGRSVEGRSVKKRSICCVVSLFAGEQDQIDATTDDLASIDQKLVESEEDLEGGVSCYAQGEVFGKECENMPMTS